ncbi:uncharacterized protein LOC126850602 [Cataglyphis hispanica]|uniref:uncharacterized protein LOC126850602 n=1 Tax=Cataglyphis hispanica TaxID=1086592 RepID=UPI00217F6E27|nr:uncharacterized protein LOC126850602 [Cataglyphis hispanica]
MTDILNIEGEPVFDDRIIKIETHIYVNTTFIAQRRDTNTHITGMYCRMKIFYIKGKLTINKPIEGSDVALGNNCITFMFDKIRYELDGVEIDRNRNVGITRTLKNYVTISSDKTVIMRNAGWDTQTNANGYFNYCVPLYMLLGFCEDNKRVVINARHELILIRSRNDNCLIRNLEPVINIFKIQWQMPHVILNEINKLSMLRALESGRYRTTKHSWAITTATQLEKLRYVVFALQTDRKNVMSEDINRFDDCKLNNVKLYVNSECYPYDDMNLDFDKNRRSILYDTYQRFCKNYYGYEYLEPSLTVTQFLLNGPFVIIDCSRQNESVKSATVDERLEFEC